MADFLALTSRGLSGVLRDELEALGYRKLKVTNSGVFFESNWLGCYRANFLLRSATRVVLPILDFQAYQPEDLYNHIFKKHDFTKYIEPDQTISVEAKARDSKVFRHDHFVGQKVKDAIVDQFRKKFDRRPSVDGENPHLRVLVKVVRSQVSVAIDTSGAPLSHRGYREKAVMAPMREHLAAGLILATGWRGETPLVDPMCGSGTLLTEALWLITKTPPGILRREFGFERLKNFNREGWVKLREEELALAAEAKAQVETQRRPVVYGFDRSSEAIRAAQTNIKAAGVAKLAVIERSELRQLKAPNLAVPVPGVLVLNPPYGERIGGSSDELGDLYRTIGEKLKSEFNGWTCWLLSGNDELTANLRLKASLKIPVFNGNLECRFLKYEILPKKDGDPTKTS